MATLLLGALAMLYPGEGSLTLTGAPARAAEAPRAAVPAPAATPVPATPVAVPGLADGPACPAPWPPGWLAAENARPGVRLAIPAGTPDATSVVGFTDRPSAACGEVVTVQLSGPATTVELVAYRIGDYDGAGARAVWRSPAISV